MRARSALIRLSAEWPDWCGAYEDDLLVAAPLLGVTRLSCPSGNARWIDLVSRVLDWLFEQGSRDGSFPGDGPAQASAIRAIEAIACTAPHAYRWPARPRPEREFARALASALTHTPAESWSPPRTWRDLALDPRPGTLPLRLDPTRDDVRALLRRLVATQRADGTWTHVAQDPREERPELATAVNALLLACALFEPDGTLSRGRE